MPKCPVCKKKLGWETKTNLEDGLRKTYEWFYLNDKFLKIID